MKKIKGIVIILACIVLYTIPLVAIYTISKHEISQYKTKVKDVFIEKAYGELISPIRSTVRENYIVSGEIISQTYKYIELPNNTATSYNLSVSVDDEIRSGQIVGYAGNLPVYANCNGIVKEIIQEDKSLIKVLAFEELLLKVNVSKEIAQKFDCPLVDDYGNTYSVVEKSNQVVEGGIDVVFSITGNHSYNYGEKIKKLTLYTGREFKDVLTIDKSCIYTKPNNDGSYVRVCNEKGEYINEQKIEMGFEVGNLACITGIDENVLCDSGYKYVVNGGEIDTYSIDDVEENN